MWNTDFWCIWICLNMCQELRTKRKKHRLPSVANTTLTSAFHLELSHTVKWDEDISTKEIFIIKQQTARAVFKDHLSLFSVSLCSARILLWRCLELVWFSWLAYCLFYWRCPYRLLYRLTASRLFYFIIFIYIFFYSSKN